MRKKLNIEVYYSVLNSVDKNKGEMGNARGRVQNLKANQRK